MESFSSTRTLLWEELIDSFVQFSLYAFADAGKLESIKKLKSEIKELEESISNSEDPTHEFVDCIMCLLHSAARANITPEDLKRGFEEKLRINKGRKWIKNADNTYSHFKSMERNTKTTIYHLQPGDRFYKCSDKNKMVFEKIEHATKQTSFQTYRHWCIWAGFVDNVNLSAHAKEAAAIAIKSGTEVIFLRHKTEE